MDAKQFPVQLQPCKAENNADKNHETTGGLSCQQPVRKRDWKAPAKGDWGVDCRGAMPESLPPRPMCLGLPCREQARGTENHLNTAKTQHTYKHKVKVKRKNHLIKKKKKNPPYGHLSD